jgi:transcriptional regulator with XRE-family HTH domain
MLTWHVRTPLVVGVMLAGLGTSSMPAVAAEGPMRPIAAGEHTTSGGPVVLTESVGAAIAELRRLSGLTWEQLARLFAVSRRSLHFWASGKAMSPANEEHVQRVLSVLHKIDRGLASANRAELLTVRADGTIPFDLLAEGHYERVVTAVGAGEGHRARAPKPSAAAIAARAPQPPEELVGALQDRVHPASGRLLATKAVHGTRRK